MATSPSVPLSVEQLLEAVDHLSPTQRREFQRRLAARPDRNGDRAADEAALIQAARARLPAAAERRLKRLIAKSERGQLTPKELADYQTLAQRSSESMPHAPKRWCNWHAGGVSPCRRCRRNSAWKAKRMARKAIPRGIRRKVRVRADDCCEYCRHPASYSCAPFVCEHVLPRAGGAGSSFAELVWACPACNGHKYDKTHAPDPQTGRSVPLFNPRRQRWARHFAWSADSLHIAGRTATGRATVVALHMNCPALVNLHRALKAVREHPPDPS